jgi:hypothetical protein
MLGIAVLALIAAVLVIPEVRKFLRLEREPSAAVPTPVPAPAAKSVTEEIRDRVISVDAEMVQRGPNNLNNSPTQYLTRGHAVISYTGTGLIQNGRLIACMTEDEEDFEKGTNHCFDIDEEDVPVRVGTQTYPFLVYMPGGDEWKRTVDHVTIMVCVVTTGSNYFEQPSEERFRRATPICGFRTLKF